MVYGHIQPNSHRDIGLNLSHLAPNLALTMDNLVQVLALIVCRKLSVPDICAARIGVHVCENCPYYPYWCVELS